MARSQSEPQTPSTPGQPAPEPKAKSTLHGFVELVVIVLGAIGLALGIQAFIVKPYRIPSGSMEPTLIVGQRILANRIGMSISGPHVGEIVVFHPPKGASNEQCGPTPGQRVHFGTSPCDETNPEEDTGTNFIKRVVAGPGDEIYVSEGHVYRRAAGKSSFVGEHDPYIKPCQGRGEITIPRSVPLSPQRFATSCDFPQAIKIPRGHWFMMGDNRGGSDDSRFWGPVPTGWMIGGAFATYWPLDRLGLL
ncbi:MAG TPA: signal peptidase I [Solirubrobacteraceae bacterium]